MFESLALWRQESTRLKAPLTSNHKQRPEELFPAFPEAVLSLGKRLRPWKQKIQTSAVETELMEC